MYRTTGIFVQLSNHNNKKAGGLNVDSRWPSALTEGATPHLRLTTTTIQRLQDIMILTPARMPHTTTERQNPYPSPGYILKTRHEDMRIVIFYFPTLSTPPMLSHEKNTEQYNALPMEVTKYGV